jgi:alpha-1,3-rhamnosyltransferase
MVFLMSNEQPKISVLIPAYNHENYVEKTLRSFAEQDYGNVELIVINDGSQDATHQKIESVLAEIESMFSSVKYVNQKNQGVIKTLNKAVSLSTGEYIYLGASDDYLHASHALSRLSEMMASDNSIGLVWGDAVIVDEDGERVGWDEKQDNVSLDSAAYRTTHPFFTRGRNITEEELGSYASLIKDNYLSNALLVRKSCLIEAGGYENSNGLEGAYRWHDSNTVKDLPSHVMIDFYKFLLKEKDFCKSQGLMAPWLSTSRIFFKALKKSGVSKTELKQGLSGWEYILLNYRQCFSLYSRLRKVGKHSS